MSSSPARQENTAGRQHAADTAAFHRARLRLTAWYVLLLAVITISFSVALYVAFVVEIPHGGETTNPDPQRRVEHEAGDFALDRLRLFLLAGNVVVLAGAAAGAYLLAGRTLRPLAASLARQRRFAADASHELRTPLTVIRGTIDVALQRDRAADAYREVLQEVGEEAAALTAIVEHLLQLARGTVASRDGAVADVPRVLEEVRRGMRDFADEQGSTLTVTAAPGLWARLDPTALRQVVTNLVENGLRHTPRGSVVRVEARQLGGTVQISVQDNGPGIPVAEQELIFEPFHRARAAAGDGAGLGLSLVSEIVTNAGGSVRLESTPGAGSTFFLRVPAVPDPESKPHPKSVLESGQ